MFKRKIYDKLLSWKKRSNGSSALLIEGARRIGKTTVCEELGKNEYPRYKTIDFSIASNDFMKNFDNLMDIEEFFSKIFLDLKMSPLPKGSLIIFDEIQFCPKARQAIKTLVKDGRYHYIETGSLVSIKENTSTILIPSEEESIQMYPMDYEEFLWALGLEYEADTLKNALLNKKYLSESLHHSFMNNYRLYLAIGGMPKAVDTYINTHDFYLTDIEKKKILKLYEEDLRKIDNKYNTICSLVWKQMPAMLSKHSTRFLVSSVDERADSILFQNTLDKLIESKMVIPVFKCNDPSGGFELSKDSSMFKLYFSDVGLFTSRIHINNLNDARDIYQRLILDKLSLNLGMFFENAVAQTLCSNNYIPFYYSWSEVNQESTKKQYEIDFIINQKNKVSIFEVKSKKVSSLESFTKFNNKVGKNIGNRYIVKTKPFKFNDDIIEIPFYMLFAI